MVDKDLINRLTPSARKIILTSKTLAMRGRFNDAIAQLLESSLNSPSIIDRVALLMTEAELLFLDGRETDSLQVFRTQIAPHYRDLPHQISAVVADNENVVARALYDQNSGYQYAKLVDQRRMAGINTESSWAFLEAKEAAAKGDHFESLPILWRALNTAYREGYWREFATASSHFGRECLALGWPWEAAHHAIKAQDEQLARNIGQNLTALRNEDAIKQTVEKLIQVANLRRHATIAFALLECIGDVLPEALTNEVVKFILPRCAIPLTSWASSAALTGAWKAATHLWRHLNQNHARSFVKAAVRHPVWKQSTVQRRDLIRTVVRCIPKLSVGEKLSLARASLPLATDNKGDVDYVDALELLAHLSEHGNKQVKTLLVANLYPPKTPVPALLIQMTKHFGKKLSDPKRLNDWAKEIMRDLELQVQHLKPGEAPAPPPGNWPSVTNEDADRKTVAYLGSSDLYVGALIKHREHLNANSMTLIVSTILKMIAEPENLLTNKATLLDFIGQFSDRLNKALAKRVYLAVAPIARGEVKEPTITMSQAEAQNPLNRYSIRTGRLTEVRGWALKTLAKIVHQWLPRSRREFEGLLRSAITDSDAEIRRYALGAARVDPRLCKLFLAHALASTRSADTNEVVAAWHLIVSHKGRFPKSLLPSLIDSMARALQAPETAVRANAAGAFIAKEKELNREAQQKLIRMIDTDVSAWVRSSIKASAVRAKSGR